MPTPIRSKFLTATPVEEHGLLFDVPWIKVPAALLVGGPSTIYTPPNPTTTNVRAPTILTGQFVETALIAGTAIYAPIMHLATLQTIYPSRFPLRSPYYITAVVHEPGVGTYTPELDAVPHYLYANIEVNQDTPADVGADFYYQWVNVGIQRPGDLGSDANLYLYVNPVVFVKMPMIFNIASAQPLAPGSALSGWGILPMAVE